MTKKTLMVIVCVLFAGSFVLADDVFPPTWRGQDRTVYAHWDNWDDDPASVAPDSFSTNPVLPDDPYAVLSGADVIPDDFMGRSGVIEMFEDFGVEFWLPNYDANPTKQVQIQITYWLDNNNVQVIPGWYLPGGESVVYSTLAHYASHPDGWITEVWGLIIEPNPSEEWFSLFATDRDLGDPWYPAYIDQVVIDTQCIPEPITLTLFMVGGLTLNLRRRRS